MPALIPNFLVIAKIPTKRSNLHKTDLEKEDNNGGRAYITTTNRIIKAISTCCFFIYI